MSSRSEEHMAGRILDQKMSCDWHLRQPKVSTHVPFPAVKLKCSQGLDVRSKLQKFDYPFYIILWSSDSGRTRCGIVLFIFEWT